MIKESDIITYGKFLKTHGLKGELNAVTEGYEIDFLTDKTPVIVNVEGIYVPFYCESVRPKGRFGFLIKLNDIDSIEEAQPFVNHEMYVLRSQLADFLQLEVDELENDFADEVTGKLMIDDNSGKNIGTITGIDDSTENILFIVESPDGEELLIPIADEYILSIDDDEGTVLVRLPEGLIDINS